MTSLSNPGGHGEFAPSTPDAPALEPVANICANGSCPTVYRTDRGTIVVQGYAVPVDFELPAGELAVEIPVDLLREASRHLS